jgi:hypothetical protein
MQFSWLFFLSLFFLYWGLNSESSGCYTSALSLELIIQQLSIHIIVIFSLHRYTVLQYHSSYHSVFLPLLLRDPRVVSWLQTCFTYKFAYDNVCFCVCDYILDLSSAYERNCRLCHSEPGLLHLAWCPSIASIYLQTKHVVSFFLMVE